MGHHLCCAGQKCTDLMRGVCYGASPANRVTSQSSQVVIRGTDGAAADWSLSDLFEGVFPHHASPQMQ